MSAPRSVSAPSVAQRWRLLRIFVLAATTSRCGGLAVDIDGRGEIDNGMLDVVSSTTVTSSSSTGGAGTAGGAEGGGRASGSSAGGGGTAGGSQGGGGASSSSMGGGGASNSSTTGAGASSSSQGGGGTGDGCLLDSDCPAPPQACAVAKCDAGVCGTTNVAAGTLLGADVPADCHAMVCDGSGSVSIVVDTSNVPPAAKSCLLGTCDAMGVPGVGVVQAGATCAAAAVSGKCDGLGNCVQCLQVDDCLAGQTCSVVHTCVPAACGNGIKDGLESDIDCGGGVCVGCPDDKGCKLGTDCLDGVCQGGTCAKPTCQDSVKNGNETDVDCGGGTCAACPLGQKCVVDSDCTSDICDVVSLICVANRCADHKQDGGETDVDCGGANCQPCASGKKCVLDPDCASNACDTLSKKCVAGPCNDHHQDGAETDIDCGGGTCPACLIGQGCGVDSDCALKACDGMSNTCVGHQCSDHRQDGDETDVDCGGICPLCALGSSCKVDDDCASFACDGVSFICIADQCNNHQLDGMESDIDCGGGVCATCALTQQCIINADCMSGACDTAAFACVADPCTDHHRDGAETDVDCGGPDACPRCGVGKKCGDTSDCLPAFACKTGVGTGTVTFCL